MAFSVMGIIFLGFFLIIPQTYTRLSSEDLGTVGNTTLVDAYNVSMVVQNLSGVLIIAAGVITLVAVVIFVFGRRFG